jgi:glycyl-tRNA synthetase alpha chain
MFLNDVDNVYDLHWNNDVTYREVRHRDEYEFSKYYFESADTAMYFRMFADWEKESQRLLREGLVLAAYECCLKCSHNFNILDARGAISVTERAQIIGRVRSLAVAVAKAYVESRKLQGFPLLRNSSGEVASHAV